jgi:hypothetical protein
MVVPEAAPAEQALLVCALGLPAAAPFRLVK